MGHVHPPIAFPVYGLDGSWQGPRWLEFVQATSGAVDGELVPGRIREVTVAHGTARNPSTDEVPWVLVATIPRVHPEWPEGRSGDEQAAEGAQAAIFQLLNRTTPSLSSGDRQRYRARTSPLLDRIPEQRSSWDVVTWTVDGSAMTARVFSWGGAWAGFSTGLPGEVIYAVGRGLAPTLSLARITNGAPYHFDLGAPVRFSEDLDASVIAALGQQVAFDEDQSWPLHPDQELLLREP